MIGFYRVTADTTNRKITIEWNPDLFNEPGCDTKIKEIVTWIEEKIKDDPKYSSRTCKEV